MSTEINLEMIDLDTVASFMLAAYIEAKQNAKEWNEKADAYAEQVKSAMGDHTIGLVNGREAVRFSKYETRRIDTAKIRKLLTADQIKNIETVTIARRFTIVEE